MRSAVLSIAVASLLPTFVGCAGGSQSVEAAVQDSAAPAQAPTASNNNNSQEARHPLVRALLDSLNGVEAEEADIRSVRQSLLDADEELVRVSGANMREAILRANQKPPILMVHPEYQEPVPGVPADGAVPDAAEPAEETPPVNAPVPPARVPDAATPPADPAAETDPFGNP